ncbi:hypothetical protein Q1695_002021 [Nippostrongylus brasiliensis]|nr:hypothetical protein Q1695_002021 [Nippostrongylus brasiliensis]
MSKIFPGGESGTENTSSKETSRSRRKHGRRSRRRRRRHSSQEVERLSLMQVVILLQFAVTITLVIFACVGVSINQPIGYIFLLALLQFLITIPGFAYHFSESPAHFFAYILLQAITVVSEIIWFIYIALSDTYTVIHLMILIILIIVQTVALLSATLLRKVHVNLSDKYTPKVRRKCRQRSSRSKSRSRRKTSASSSSMVTSKEKGDTSTARRRTSRDLEQGPDESSKVIKHRRRRSADHGSLLKYKDGRKKIRQLAQHLRASAHRSISNPELADTGGGSTETSQISQKGSSSVKSKSAESILTGNRDRHKAMGGLLDPVPLRPVSNSAPNTARETSPIGGGTRRTVERKESTTTRTRDGSSTTATKSKMEVKGCITRCSRRFFAVHQFRLEMFSPTD